MNTSREHSAQTRTSALEERVTCPVCRQSDDIAFFLNKEGYDLYKCSLCNHLFVWPVPSIEDLQHVYSFANSFQVQPKTIFDESTHIGEKPRESLKQIEHFANKGELLDIGCSSGKFLFLARKNGWSVRGVELNKDTAEIALYNGLEVTMGELSDAHYAPESFDAIHIGDVIEHVQDPTSFMRQVRKLLKADGVIVLVTPNHDAVFPRLTYGLHRIFRMPWSHPTPPYHLNQFSENSFEKLLATVDMKVIDKRYRRCELLYELGEAHLLRPCRRARDEKKPALAFGRLIFAILTAVAYTVAYAIDICCFWKRKDFEMRFAVKKMAA